MPPRQRRRRVRTPDTKPQQQLGENIREHRLRLGLTQEELAHGCELHPTEIGRIERGERDLRLTTIMRVARGLEVSAADLMIKLD